MSIKKSISTENFPTPIGAYSNGLVVPVGDKELIVLTGQVALAKDGTVACEKPADQMRFIFENIKELLQAAGADIDNIIRVVIYVTDMNYFGEISPVRNEYLKDSRPVSTLVEVNKLAVDGCKVEVEVTAIK